ncbi:hypothetical protein CAPTEDRAFT_223171 [Capitella teleta]|uniref:Phospholipid scramblase n=1 Tax=Capitella teleta TaxID=283909 RepID=R7TC88_CAPTE|nr:hypothetical protein CAPTEDRAFT_223171 [Capitella teleta]|eukprot:ELT89117.1 hypothetical protein CAPTEDRAFT_223171 [Capitella teleta]
MGPVGLAVVSQGGMSTQIATGSWMQRPSVAAGCPPGLEYLTLIDQLLVKQQIELAEVLLGWECNNRYAITNSVGQQVYFCSEESDVCMRQMCKNNRPFTFHVTDNTGQEVIRLNREFKCCAMGCCWCAGMDCCAHEVTVEAPVGTVVGYATHRKSGWHPYITLYNADHEQVAHVDGPCCVCNCPCCGDIDFKVTSKDRSTEIGNISKHWSGAFQEVFTAAQNFQISFPMDMDVRIKAVMMGALFLVDFLYFEKQN